MIINPNLPSGHTIFCDDIREEVSGKITLVGVYAAAMYVQEIPSTLPQLCASLVIREKPDSASKVIVRILFESDGEDRLLMETEYSVEGQLSLPPTEEFSMREIRLNAKMAHFEIKSEGRLKARAFIDGDEVRLGAMPVQKMPSSS